MSSAGSMSWTFDPTPPALIAGCPRTPGRRQAMRKRNTLSRVIWSSGAYFVLAESPASDFHCPSLAPRWAPSVTVIAADSARTIRIHSRVVILVEAIVDYQRVVAYAS